MVEGVSAFALFVLGAAIGSFLNVVILRGIEGESIGGRSRCPGCSRTLRWWELLPLISFSLLRGRCNRCRRQISIQYPLVELALGITVLILGLPLPTTSSELLLSLLQIGIASLLVVLFVIDLRTMLLPDRIVVLLAIGVGIFIVVRAGTSAVDPTSLAVWSLYGALIGAGGLGILWLLTRGRGIGLGDVKVMVPIGALFGPLDVIVLLFTAFVAGGGLAAYLLVSKRATMKTAIPFGPFLCGAALLFLLVPALAKVGRELLFGGWL